MSYQPKKGADFYMVNSRGVVNKTTHNGSQKMLARIAFGNAFKTQAEAEAFRDQVKLFATKGIYRTGTYQPKFGIITKILTYLTYLLLALVMVALCCLVIDFIFWIFDINVTVFGIKV